MSRNRRTWTGCIGVAAACLLVVACPDDEVPGGGGASTQADQMAGQDADTAGSDVGRLPADAVDSNVAGADVAGPDATPIDGQGGTAPGPSVQHAILVDDRGGALDLPLGGRLEIPPGALAGPVVITATLVDPPVSDDFEVLGPFVEMGPDGLQFLTPVRLRMPLPLSPMEDEEAFAQVGLAWSAPDGMWEYHGLVEWYEDMTVEAEIEHFSKGGMVAFMKAQPLPDIKCLITAGPKYCDGNKAVNPASLCNKTKKVTDCTPLGKVCSQGKCIAPCTKAADCADGGPTEFCPNASLSQWWSCNADGTCKKGELACSTYGPKYYCTTDHCTAGCASSTDCAHGGAKYCLSGSLQADECVEHQCVQKVVSDCAAQGQLCNAATCKPKCTADTDCGNGGAPTCDGVSGVKTWTCASSGECVGTPQPCPQSQICVGAGQCKATCLFSSYGCPSEPQCDGDEVFEYSCQGFLCEKEAKVDCAAVGKTCSAGQCVFECLNDGDCTAPPACAWNVAATSYCDSNHQCAQKATQCGGLQATCADGQCVAGDCTSTSQCPGGGEVYCSQGLSQAVSVCSGGQCVVSPVENCTGKGGVCTPVACTQCSSDAQCPNNGEPWCAEGKVSLWACVGGMCAESISPCSGMCYNNTCLAACSSSQPCPPPMCNGTDLWEFQCTTGLCVPALEADCADQLEGGLCGDGQCVTMCADGCPTNTCVGAEGGLSWTCDASDGFCKSATFVCDTAAGQVCSGGECELGCASDAGCPGGGETTCVGDSTGHYSCVQGTCAWTPGASCAQFGLICADGLCQKPCTTVLDCDSGGAPVCAGNVLYTQDCVNHLCVQSTADCAADNKVCVDGGCIGTGCSNDADCPHDGLPFCEQNAVKRWVCDVGTSSCIKAVEQGCAGNYPVCSGGACVALCSTDADCPNGGNPVCTDLSTFSQWTCGPGSICVEQVEDCTATDKVCFDMKCRDACDTDADCPGAGANVCEGDKVMWYVCDMVCYDVLVDTCTQGEVCVKDACAISCDSDDDCGANAICDNNGVLHTQTCGEDGTCAETTVDCAALGQACIVNECVQSCSTDSDCPGGGAPYCEGNRVTQYACQSYCFLVMDMDCAVNGEKCNEGSCAPPCESDADCEGLYDTYCSNMGLVHPVCTDGGTCGVATTDCEAQGMVCTGDQCAPTCEDISQCPGGSEGPLCTLDPKAGVYRVTAQGCGNGYCYSWELGACAPGEGCQDGQCLPPCTTSADCPAGGAVICSGNSRVQHTCSPTGFCQETLVGACSGNAPWCVGGVCSPSCTLGGPCDDGNICTTDDTCVQSGQCAGGPACDDGDPCTLDTCNPWAGQCTHTFDVQFCAP